MYRSGKRMTEIYIFLKKQNRKIEREEKEKRGAELAEYKTASKLTSSRSLHLEKSRSATTATTKHCAVLNRRRH